MGGKALKEIQTRRVDASEYYDDLVPSLINSLRPILGSERKLYVVESYANKENFGDVDVLVESNHDLPETWIVDVAKALGSQQVVINGGVTSLDFRNVQIDLIKCPGDEIEWTKKYFAFNDLGNLIGRIAHHMGFKFGHDGLAYVVRAPGKDEYVLREIMVSQDWDFCLEFMGFNAERYKKGFKGKQDIFDFVTSSRFFNREIFLLENRNHTSRVRDAKRPTYREFLTYCENTPGLPKFEWADKKTYLEPSLNHFPGFREEYNKALTALRLREDAQAKYNGEKVTEWTGLVEKELGQRMAMIQRVLGEGSKTLFQTRINLLSSTELQSIAQCTAETYTQHVVENCLAFHGEKYPSKPEPESNKKNLFKSKLIGR